MNELRSKIVSHSGAADLVAVWRQQGCKVGFTNGCFDLLHPGHINLLRKAREKCDRLVIGLNTDASVRRLKGLCRPVQTETARATVLSELAAVDLVVMFDEDTPLNLIELLTPDVLMKGGDYAVDQIIGGDWVIGHGGIVETIDIVSGHSTSGLIERMSQNG